MKKRIISYVLISLLIVSTVFSEAIATQAQEITVENSEVVASTSASSSKDYGLADNIQDGVILHCFNWKYNDIKAELPNIAEAGFTSVQTSPAQRDDTYGVWYMLYQPQSFSISTNALGTKEELKSLCDEAEKYGIKVIVDVVANHMRGDGNNVDDSMKKNNHYDYWHHDDLDSNRNIDWTNRYQVTHGRIGMYDLNSENSAVQNIVANYINELKSVGVDGIRWDAAKHIGLPSENCGFWKTVTSQGLYHYGEILKGPDDRESGNEGLMKEYTNYISVTDSDYGKTLRDSFNSGQAPSAYGNWCARGVADNKLVYWGESHDTWSNNKDWGYSNEMSQNVIDRAYAVAASRNGASALYFSRPSSKNKESIMAGQKGSTHFTSPEVAAINHFHNAMIGQKDYYKQSNGCAVITREQGAIIVKGSGSGSVTVENGGSLCAPGTYIDEITGNTWTVTATTISGTIGSTGIAVVYNPKPAGPSASATPGTQSYKTDTLKITLNYKNATDGEYSIDGGAYQAFTDGQIITIGEDKAYGTQTTVRVKSSNGTEVSDVETYVYTKVDPTLVQKVYFDNSSYNWSKVYCYLYLDETKNNGKWPGTQMALDSSTGYYVLEIPEGFEDGMVIFTESSSATMNRYPADQEPGLSLNSTTKIFKANHVFEQYIQATATPEPTATATPEPTATATPEPTATATPEPTATATPEPTATATPEPTATAAPEPTATATPEPTATVTPELTITATPEPIATATPEPTATATPEPTATTTPEPTAAVTPELTITATPKPTAIVVPKPTATVTPEPTIKVTSTPTENYEYTITYVMNGGHFEKEPVDTYDGKKNVSLSEPVRKGYTFVGWYTEKSCKNKVTAVRKGSKGDKIFYAKWKKVTKPSKAKILSIKNAKAKQMTVKIKKISKIDGYEITYATNERFTKNKKVINTKKTTKNIKGVKKGKKYYIKVRGYKIDSTGKKVYGSYSKIKKVTIKK